MAAYWSFSMEAAAHVPGLALVAEVGAEPRGVAALVESAFGGGVGLTLGSVADFHAGVVQTGGGAVGNVTFPLLIFMDHLRLFDGRGNQIVRIAAEEFQQFLAASFLRFHRGGSCLC